MAVIITGSHYIAHPFERPLTVVIAEKTGGDTSPTDYREELTIVSYLCYDGWG